MAGVYWLGADGNVWLKSGGSVKNVGKPVYMSNNGFDSQFLSAEATRIADPNPPKQSTPAPSNPNGGGYSSGGGAAYAPPKVDKSADIAIQQAGLNSADAQQNAGFGRIDQSFSKLSGQYDAETADAEKNYNTQVGTNQNNLQKNKQTALVNASQGRQGLLGTLGSLGALNGSGIELANRAVQKGANDDLSGAADNYASNENQLDTAIGTFRREDKARRDNAVSEVENAKQNVRADTARFKMQALSGLANDYTAMGDTAHAKTYADQVSALYPALAAANVPASGPTYSAAAFTPGTLADYMSGANSTQVTTTPGQGAGGIPGLAASSIKKKQLQPA